MSNLPTRPVKDIAQAIIDLFKEIVIRDEPEAQQFVSDLNRAFIRAGRIVKKQSAKLTVKKP